MLLFVTIDKLQYALVESLGLFHVEHVPAVGYYNVAAVAEMSHFAGCPSLVFYLIGSTDEQGRSVVLLC